MPVMSKMPDWPDHTVDNVHSLGRHEARCRILVRLRHPGSAEQNVQEWEEGCKVLVAMLGMDRMMDPVPLRIVDPGHKPAERDTDVEMGACIGDEEDKSDSYRHVRRDAKQDRHNRKEGVGQHPLKPEMPTAGNERNAVRAVMERVHRPKKRDRVLEAMVCVLVEIEQRPRRLRERRTTSNRRSVT